MSIDVAMATYNGEKYVREQIESVCEQTLKPDKIIIVDDQIGAFILSLAELVVDLNFNPLCGKVLDEM